MVTENEVVLAIDKVRAMLGELKSMAHNYNEIKQSRDRWKQFADERESELNALIAEMATCWVKLPVDAGGEAIHTGDILDGYGKTIEVVEMRYRRSGWTLISREGSGYANAFSFAHHHEQRTVEDVLEDCISDWENGRFESYEELAARHAERIRELLGVKDGK